MTESQLRYFLTIVRLGSYNQAALELNISQSSISKQIMILENELGVQLFNRNYHNIRLTLAGEKLLPQAISILDSIEHLKKTAQQLQPNYSSTISVIVLPIMGQFKLFYSLNKFKNIYPNHSVDLIELEEPALFKRIMHSQFDLAITYKDDEHYPTNHPFQTVIEDEIVAAIHIENDLSKKQYLFPQDLKEQSLLLMDKHTCLNHMTQNYLNHYGIIPYSCSYGRPETILGGVEAQCGIALVSRVLAQYYQIPSIKLISLSPALMAPLGVYINKNEANTKEINTFIQLISNQFK